VDLIFTDPVWSDKDIWTELGKWAERVLAPGGILAAYTGVRGLPVALAGLGQYLTNYWTCSLYNSEWVIASHRRVWRAWCPLVIFVKGDFRRTLFFHDTYMSLGKDKEYHPYQQSLDEALYYIKALSEPGSLVCDPFGGSFTSACAVKLLETPLCRLRYRPRLYYDRSQAAFRNCEKIAPRYSFLTGVPETYVNDVGQRQLELSLLCLSQVRTAQSLPDLVARRSPRVVRASRPALARSACTSSTPHLSPTIVRVAGAPVR
jgi:hypothetical protein